MKQCLVCKKRGLFLKLNQDGRCKTCEIAYQKQITEEKELAKAKARDIYFMLAKMFSSISKKVPTIFDPIPDLESIPEINEKIVACHEFIKLINQAEKLVYFDQILQQYRDDKSKSDRYLTYAYFDAFDLKISIHRNESSESILNLFCNELSDFASRLISRYNHIIDRIHKNAEFNRMLSSIPSVNIELSNLHFPKLATSALDELIKYNRITTKTSFDRIGTFVVIDTETTGLSSVSNEIIEISAIRFEDWTPISQFHSMVKPKKGIPTDITRITGITEAMVENAPSFSGLIPSLTEFIGNSTLIGYNLPFDLKFLYKNGLDFTTDKRKYYDVLELAKSLLKTPRKKWDRELESYEIDYDYDYDVEDHKLTTVCEHYQIRDSKTAHRASSDALATGLLFMKLAREKIPDSH